MKEISVVIPVYYSAGIVPELAERLNAALQSLDHEVILVNDGSRDGSWEAIVRAAKAYPAIVGVNLRKNSGQDNALLAGLSVARGRYVVIMDDDLQHAPEDILKLYRKCTEGFDIVYANFFVKKQKLWKNLGSWLNGKVSEALLEKPKGIYLSPFKIFRGDMTQDILNFHYPFPYLDGMLLSITAHVAQIDVEHHARYSGKSTYSLMRSVSVLLKNLTSFSVFPLRLASLLGVISATAGFFYAALVFFRYLRGESDVVGWPSLMVILLIMGGLNLFAVGVVGEYLGRAYLTINNKPPYTVREIVREKARKAKR